MKTYEELLEVGEVEKDRAEFCLQAVKQFESTQEYEDAYAGYSYYNKRNLTIEQYEKWLYTVTGRRIKDEWSPNHRIKTHHFRRYVTQIANYLAGKGVQLNDTANKEKLGKDFDSQLIKAIKMALSEGRSFGYWNYDHIEVFGFCCTDKHAGFCPLYSEDSGELMAGIRFSYRTIGKKTIMRMSLFEPDGITEYIKRGSDEVELDEERKPYKTTMISNRAEGIISVNGENYGRLPVIPLYASDTFESELNGNREAIDCYDLVKSGFANNIDVASEIFWLVKNAGGMEDSDLAKFLWRIHNLNAAAVNSEDGSTVEPHTVSVPTEARAKFLEILRTDLYDDLMLLDRRSMSAAQKTNQELQMAYQPQDDRVNDLEFFVLDFMDNILELAGIDSEVTFSRNKIVNEVEQVNMILSASNYLSGECIIRHLPFLTPEEAEEEIKVYQSEQYDRFHADGEEVEEEVEEDEE